MGFQGTQGRSRGFSEAFKRISVTFEGGLGRCSGAFKGISGSMLGAFKEVSGELQVTYKGISENIRGFMGSWRRFMLFQVLGTFQGALCGPRGPKGLSEAFRAVLSTNHYF